MESGEDAFENIAEGGGEGGVGFGERGDDDPGQRAGWERRARRPWHNK